MNPEQFIIQHITDNINCSDRIKNTIVGNALLKYRRNQFDNIETLIFNARNKLLLEKYLDCGVTVKDFSKARYISYPTAAKILKKNACARYKTANGAWVYRG